jgi:hypothetical protein
MSKINSFGNYGINSNYYLHLDHQVKAATQRLLSFILTPTNMEYEELAEIWNTDLIKLGYLENEPGLWATETKELIIKLSLKIDTKEKDFYLDIGIFFKKLHHYHSLNELKFKDHDLGQSLWTHLAYMGEWEYYLNNLFLYDPVINSAAEVKNNIRELAMLFLAKVIPHIEDLDYCARWAKNFEKEHTWYPFLQYFRANIDHDEKFSGNLYMFHVHQFHERKKKEGF